jgi:hypothetical protein
VLSPGALATLVEEDDGVPEGDEEHDDRTNETEPTVTATNANDLYRRHTRIEIPPIGSDPSSRNATVTLPFCIRCFKEVARKLRRDAEASRSACRPPHGAVRSKL